MTSMPPLQIHAHEIADEHWRTIREAKVIKINGQHSCVVYRDGLPTLIASNGSGQLVANDLARYIESRVLENRTQSATGVSA